jgi:hypothetical protein
LEVEMESIFMAVSGLIAFSVIVKAILFGVSIEFCDKIEKFQSEGY